MHHRPVPVSVLLGRIPGTTATTDLLRVRSAADETVTWHTTITIGGSQPATGHARLTFIRSGRVVSSLFDFQLGSPFPEDERTRLLTTLAGRVKGL